MSIEKDFIKMLDTDVATYANITTARVLLEQQLEYQIAPNSFKTQAEKDTFRTAFKKNIVIYNNLSSSYIDRQNDYKTNKTYKVAQYLTDASNSVTNYFYNLWNGITGGGLGMAPLALPLIWAGAATVTAAIISFFVYKYNDKTSIDYNNGLELVAELYKTNPVAANEMLVSLNAQANEQRKEGFFASLSTGVKWGAGIGTALLVGYGVYELNKHLNKKK